MIIREQVTETTNAAELLLHCDGVDASTNFPDTGGNNHTATANGNAQVDTAQSVFGGASALFDGAGDFIRITGTTTDFEFGTGALTIDFRLRPASAVGTIEAALKLDLASTSIEIRRHSDGKARVMVGAVTLESTTTLAQNTWYHIAYTRSGTTGRLFVNGVIEDTDTDNQNYASFTNLDIGMNGNATFTNGHIDEVRIKKGVAEWTSNFTPPASAYSNAATTNVDFTDSNLPVIGYDTVLTTSNVEATTEDVNFPASNLVNPATHLKWKEATASPISSADMYITVDIAQTSPPTREIDYVAIGKHNFGSIGATVSVEITSDATSPIGSYIEVASTTPLDDSPIIFQFDPVTPTHVRVKITAGNALREMAVLYVGTLLTLERSIKVDVTHVPINLGRKNDIINGMSESGNFLGRLVRNQSNESKAEFAHFTSDWYDANFDPFILAARYRPFFWAWAPNAFPKGVGLVWLIRDNPPEFNPITERFNINLEMRGIA